MNRDNKIGITSGVLSGALWGLDTVLTGIILSQDPFISTQQAIMLAPIISAFLHDTFSSLWMMIYLIFKREFAKTIKLLNTRSGRFVALAALFGGPIGMAAYLFAINYIGAGYTASISAIYPAVGAFFAYIFLKEKLSIRGWIGLGLSIISIIILGYTPDSNVGSNFFIGFIFALVCVLGWSLESVICAYGMKDDEVNSIQALQIRQLVSALFYGIIIVPIIGGMGLNKVVLTSNVPIIIMLTALVGTLSYNFYYKAIDKVGPVKATGLNVTYSIWAIIFDVLILGNAITIKLIICAMLIIIGSVLVSKN